MLGKLGFRRQAAARRIDARANVPLQAAGDLRQSAMPSCRDTGAGNVIAMSSIAASIRASPT
jgi:thiamine monophosphate synthase